MMMELDLISLDISNISDIEEDLSDVAVLNLHGNSLSTLYGIMETSKLVELNLSSNSFVSCDLPELVYLPSLKVLDLSGNRIASLQGLPFLPSVTSFAVAFNAIYSLDGVYDFPNLEVLDCRGNLIASAKDCAHIQPLGMLRDLWLSNTDGRYSNPVCSKAAEILKIFDDTRYFGCIDGSDRQRWALDAVPSISFTPKFDMVAKKFLSHGGGDKSLNPSAVENTRSGSSYSHDEDTSDTGSFSQVLESKNDMQIPAQHCISVLSAMHKRWLQGRFNIWCRAACRLSGLVTERAVSSSVASQQMLALESVIADEKQKIRILEEVICELKTKADTEEDRFLTELEAARRVAEAERQRSEQLRVQLLKHVAISNTQNAELQKSRQMCANLEAEGKKAAEAMKVYDASIIELQAELSRANQIRLEAEEMQRHLHNEAEQLRSCVSSITLELEESRVQCEGLKQQLHRVEMDVVVMQEDQSSLQSQLKVAGQELVETGKLLSQREKDVQDLETCLAEEAVTRGNLTKTIDDMQSVLTQLRDELAVSKSFAEEQKVSIEDLCSIVVDLKSTLKKNHARCKHLESQRDKTREQLEALVAQQHSDTSHFTDEKRTLKQQYNIAMESLQKEFKAVSAKKETLERSIDQLHYDIKTLNESSAKDKQVLRRAEQRADELQHALKVKDKMLDDQSDLISELRDRLGAETIEASQRVQEAEAMYESAQEEISVLQKQLRATVKMEKELRVLVSDLKNDRRDSEDDSEDEDTCGRPERRRTTNTDSPDNNENIKKEIAALHQTLSMKNKHLEAAQTELQDLAEALKHVKDKMAAVQKETENIRSDRNEALDRIKSLDRTVKELKSKVDVDNAAMQSMKIQYEQELANLTASHEELVARLERKEKELSAAIEDNKKFKDAFATLSSISPM